MHARPLIVFVILSIALVACGGEKTPVPEGASPEKSPATPAAKPAAPRLEGELLRGDKRLRVEPFVMHRPQMDLKVACLLMQDAEKEAGRQAPPLCYDAKARKDIKAVRLESMDGATVAEMTRYLRVRGEAAHFLVERTGTIYQVLDLAYAPRREAVYQPTEVRILSGSPEGTERLLRALRSHLSEYAVRRLDVDFNKIPGGGEAQAAPPPVADTAPEPPGGQGETHDHP